MEVASDIDGVALASVQLSKDLLGVLFEIVSHSLE